MTIRIELAQDIASCSATGPIQSEVWTNDLIVPPQLMLAVTHDGGFVALGYVEGDDRAAGFVFGFLGIRDSQLRHHSHMLAVRSRYRGTSLARDLKVAQRDHCLSQGVEIIGWTMDPLEARNATFNFAKLGTYTREYHRDFYGAMPDKLNAGLPSDRFYVEWPIANDRTYKRLRGENHPRSLDDVEREGIRYLLRAEGDLPGHVAPPADETHLLLEIPARFQELKARDPALALAWRMAARAAFESALSRGYVAVDFLRAADERCAYVLVSGDRR